MLRPALRVRALAADAGVALTHLRTMALGGEVVALPAPLAAADAEALAAALAGHADVKYAFPDGWRQPLVRANDEFIGGQGYLENEPDGISAFAAWDVTTGSAANVVAVIDTGFRPHADMEGRNLPGYDFISDPQVANDGDGRDVCRGRQEVDRAKKILEPPAVDQVDGQRDQRGERQVDRHRDPDEQE